MSEMSARARRRALVEGSVARNGLTRPPWRGRTARQASRRPRRHRWRGRREGRGRCRCRIRRASPRRRETVAARPRGPTAGGGGAEAGARRSRRGSRAEPGARGRRATAGRAAARRRRGRRPRPAGAPVAPAGPRPVAGATRSGPRGREATRPTAPWAAPPKTWTGRAPRMSTGRGGSARTGGHLCRVLTRKTPSHTSEQAEPRSSALAESTRILSDPCTNARSPSASLAARAGGRRPQTEPGRVFA